MDNLEKLSDTELRERLIQYGFANIPVTTTTRKLLINKLRNLIKTNKIQRKSKASLVAQYSSGDDSEVENKNARRKTTTSSKSTAFASPSPNLNYSSPGLSSRRTTALSHSKVYVPSPVRSTDIGIGATYPDYSSNRASTSFETDSSFVAHNGYNNPDPMPYTSQFSRRLQSLRALNDHRNSQPMSSANTSFQSELPSMSRSSLSFRESKKPPSKFSVQNYGTSLRTYCSSLGEQYGSLVPTILVCAFALFLTLVTFTYISITPDIGNIINEHNAIYDLCDHDSDHLIECIDAGSLEPAFKLLKSMVVELQKGASNRVCNTSPKIFTLSAKDVIQRLSKDSNIFGMKNAFSAVHGVEYLIDRNPQWKVNNVDEHGKPLSFDQVLQLRSNQSNHFAIVSPGLSLFCLLYIKIQTIFTIIGVIILCGAASYAVYFVYKFISNRIQENDATFKYYLDQITYELQCRASNENGDKGFVAINHLRDKIIPVYMRKDKEAVWNKAIKYIEQHDSRVQFDMQIINGESCKVIKWIDSSLFESKAESRLSSDSVKKWHSSAFDRSNKISHPPTPCLKIRQMFDSVEANDPNLKTIVQDAILEKVGSKCSIYDIQLDTETCCVYVKCASEKDAGIVHNEINGWWFDKRLVSIKFLRLERYMSRFPHSSCGPNILRPSNTKNLSMSQCRNLSLNGHDYEQDDEENYF